MISLREICEGIGPIGWPMQICPSSPEIGAQLGVKTPKKLLDGFEHGTFKIKDFDLRPGTGLFQRLFQEKGVGAEGLPFNGGGLQIDHAFLIQQEECS